MNNKDEHIDIIDEIKDCPYCENILCHHELMTLRLKEKFNSDILIEKKEQYETPLGWINRKVILHNKKKNILFAKIEINKEKLSKGIVNKLINSNAPFGAVIYENDINVRFINRKLFRINTLSHSPNNSKCKHTCLYGRSNDITDKDNNILAKVSEYVL
ncbi:hypothetical protein [Vibrio lentus]|uniref:Uncharacterized protein n=1 Tax=Vibrio lentus TaxID=136468 RepID=A0A2N7BT22_9VIBR|nr:hypothetical protein [Vibrio lentus]PME54317.1 hypothetical protein BCV34_05050 [Vibrio lentus]PME62909.1 hypothetical protein BCV30_09840 [Vibrio lentus]PME77621.1 hypothetical protein BCV27_18795 [Vibrio lentus]PMG76721.1 hypothetical protein BCU86_02555 [Vibrio lentus]PMH92308.1 hypothetical protein BCU56_01020 [Vibrio lentus]